jgi:hypothetical protein
MQEISPTGIPLNVNPPARGGAPAPFRQWPRQGKRDAWSSFGGALAREYSTPAEVDPQFAPVKPTLPKLRWMTREVL